MSLIVKYSIAAALLLVAVLALFPLLAPSTAVAEGETCSSDSECASGEECDLDQGVCVVPGPDNPGPGCTPQPETWYCKALRLACERGAFPASLVPCAAHALACSGCS